VLSGESDFPLNIFVDEKIGQKVIAGEKQKSIYGAVVGKLN